tara:strand:- start:221 stop:1003 length:783 start_codon:yes stop_codon:yes gene_type:complete
MECKKITKKFVAEVRNQNVTDVMSKLNTALKYQDDDTICRIEFNYDEQNHSLFGDAYFGDSDINTESDDDNDFGGQIESENENETSSNFGDNWKSIDEVPIDTEFGGKNKMKTSRDPFNMSAMYEGLDDDMEDETNSLSVPKPMISSISKGITKQKKVSDMTIPEIEERMLRMHGAKYLSEFKPEKYKTKSGGTSVRYIRRAPKCVSTTECTCTPRVMDTSLSRYGDCPACMIAKFGNETSVFSDFNTEDTNYGNDELLF